MYMYIYIYIYFFSSHVRIVPIARRSGVDGYKFGLAGLQPRTHCVEDRREILPSPPTSCRESSAICCRTTSLEGLGVQLTGRSATIWVSRVKIMARVSQCLHP